MRWLQTEYLLKGIYLGLVLYAALQQAALPPDKPELAVAGLLRLNLLTLGGLALTLGMSAVARLREGYRARGRLVIFVLFLLLESPTLVYLGLLGGTLAGIFLVRDLLATAVFGPFGEKAAQAALDHLLLPTLAGAAVAGLAFGGLRRVRRRRVRGLLILALAGGLVVAALSWLGILDLGAFGLFGKNGRAGPTYPLGNPTLFSVQLLLGIPFFYLLTFAGQEEESEVEIGAICAALGLGLAILAAGHGQVRSLAFLVPLVLFFVYTTRVLPGLRVLKHVFRGLSYTRAGRYPQALQAFRRALQLDPANRLAREGFWDIHRSLDLGQLAHDPQTLALVDLDLCLDRAGSLLVQGTPTPAQLGEARRLLDLVHSLEPGLEPTVAYWRTVADTHARQFDQAAAELEQVLDPARFGPDNPHRQAVLLPAWRLALTLHEELRRRVGAPVLARPGRRLEAIAAVERHLAANPDDQAVWGLKRLLYQDVTEADYDSAAGPGLPSPSGAHPPFDHAYVQQLGLALIDDSARWQRGGEYLRLAARGLPALGPTLFVQIAQAHRRAGHPDEARHNYELAKRAGVSVGPKNLADEERQAYFATVKMLAEEALARGDLDAAIENWHLYTESERSGLETLRTLATLHEQKGDPLSALRVNDQALVYNPRDPDLVERKDRYYYSVMPDDLRARLDTVRSGFDFAYCLHRARTILDSRNPSYDNPEWLDVAHHLLQLALVVRPESLTARVLLARVLLRYGQRDQALAMLEEVRSPKPEKFADEDEEAWYIACQFLGDLYLEVDRPDLAVPCFLDFRKSPKSGARTLFKLGQAYEQLGDRARAVRCYQQVTAYDGNPLAPDAYEALNRLQAT
jgi:tetratricopeptide (TPR) repeat protein